MKWFDYLFAVIQWALIAVVSLVSNVVGLPVVALIVWGNLSVEAESTSDGRKIVTAPRWLWLFGNDKDGYKGDKRLWWAENCDAKVFFGLFPFLRRFFPSLRVLTADDKVCQWWWGAVRNPVNNTRFTSLLSATVSGSTVTYIGDYAVRDRVGGAGIQFVRTVGKRFWQRWYGFYWVHMWNAERALVVRLGFKVEPKQAGFNDDPEGETFRIAPFKKL